MFGGVCVGGVGAGFVCIHVGHGDVLWGDEGGRIKFYGHVLYIK